MKKSFIKNICIIFIGVLVLTGCNNDKNELKTDNNIELILNSYYAYSKSECTPFNELYFKDDNYTYYKVCVDYIELDFKDTKLVRDLKESILSDETSLDDLIDNSKNKEKYGLYNVYFYDSFNLAINNYKIYLIHETINYKNYLDSLDN